MTIAAQEETASEQSSSTRSDTTNQRPPLPVFAFSPLTAASFPKIKLAIAHLRNILGEQTYEVLARKGETTTTASMVSYDYDQSTRPEQN